MRYAPRQEWSIQLPSTTEEHRLEVYEDDEAEYGSPTGLLDKDGCELMRYDRIKLGFIK